MPSKFKQVKRSKSNAGKRPALRRPGGPRPRANPIPRPGGAVGGGMNSMTLEQLAGMLGGGAQRGASLESGGGYGTPPAMGGGLRPFQPNIGMGVNRGPGVGMPPGVGGAYPGMQPGGTPQISQPFTPPPGGMGGTQPRLPPVMPPPNNIGKSFGGIPTGYGAPSGGPNSAPIGGRPYGF